MRLINKIVQSGFQIKLDEKYYKNFIKTFNIPNKIRENNCDD